MQLTMTEVNTGEDAWQVLPGFSGVEEHGMSDRRKFLRYRSHLDSLRDYLLLSTERPWIEHYQRLTDGHWLYSSHEGLDATLELTSIGCRLPLAEVYERIEFAALE